MKWYLYDWGGANVWLFHLINNTHNYALDKVMLTGTGVGSHNLFAAYLTALILIALMVIARTAINNPGSLRMQVVLWSSVIAVFGISFILDARMLSIIKPLLNFPRPPLALPTGSLFVIGQPEYHYSFPSGHSSFAMLIVASIWPLLVRWQKLLGVIFVLWVGLSRISLGAHFPADVLAGWISSFLIVLFVRYAVNTIMHRKRG